jgi:hypothetical protein
MMTPAALGFVGQRRFGDQVGHFRVGLAGFGFERRDGEGRQIADIAGFSQRPRRPPVGRIGVGRNQRNIGPRRIPPLVPLRG